MKIKLIDLLQDTSDLDVSLVESNGDGTFQVYFDVMDDGEVLGVQANISGARARELELVDLDGEPVDLA